MKNKIYPNCKVIHSEIFVSKKGEEYVRLYALAPNGAIYPVVCPVDSPCAIEEFIPVMVYSVKDEKTGVYFNRSCVPRHRA